MRRLPRSLVVLAFSLILVACGGSTSPASNAPGDASSVVFSVGASGGAPAEPPVATVEPTPEADAGLRLDDLTHTRTGDKGNVTFAGVVVNAGQSEARIEKISIELYDSAGQRISRISFTNPPLPILKPGEATRWQGQATELVGEWQEVRGTVVVVAPTAAR